jgi:hypothetical protein
LKETDIPPISHYEISERRAPLARRILGSALSALAGWITLCLATIAVVAFEPDRSVSEQLAEITFTCAYAAIFVGVTWLLALLPLYLVLPLRSLLWRWYVCTGFGILAGGIIMYVFVRCDPLGSTTDLLFILLAAITGGTTCLFGSLTARYFQYETPPDQQQVERS